MLMVTALYRSCLLAKTPLATTPCMSCALYMLPQSQLIYYTHYHSKALFDQTSNTYSVDLPTYSGNFELSTHLSYIIK